MKAIVCKGQANTFCPDSDVPIYIRPDEQKTETLIKAMKILPFENKVAICQGIFWKSAL